ncbi:MAG TPA: L,D-transpeptidase, partial [Byssovorax sp.]
MGRAPAFWVVTAGALLGACSERSAVVRDGMADEREHAHADAKPAAEATPGPVTVTPAAAKVAHADERPAPVAATEAGGAEVDTSTRAAWAPPTDGARIYAKARFAWIQPSTTATRGWLGYLSYGGAVRLKGGSAEAARAPEAKGCKAWYAVEPFGFVCANDAATLDGADPVVAALTRDAPDVGSPWPYAYAESHGAQRYARVPTVAEQQRVEFDLAAHLAAVEAVRGGAPATPALAGVDVAPAGAPAGPLAELSPLVRDARAFVQLGSTIAYTRSFDDGGRTFVVTSDHAIVPKDRVAPYPRSTFHGVEIGERDKLPLAFIRKADAPKYRRVADGKFEKTSDAWPRLSHVGVTGKKELVEHRWFWETVEGTWAYEPEATVIELATAPAERVAPDAKGRRTWLDVSVLGGTLVAYEGERPVYATLVSPGRGGVPFEGKDPLETASTPTGMFRVDGKFVTATMVS